MTRKIKLTGDARRVLRRVLESEQPDEALQADLDALPREQQRAVARRVGRDTKRRLVNGDMQLREARAVRRETVAGLKTLDAILRVGNLSNQRQADLASERERLAATLASLDGVIEHTEAKRKALVADLADLNTWSLKASRR